MHAVILVAISYSEFFPRLWRFEAGQLRRASGPVLGITIGSIISVIVVICVVAGQDSAQASGRAAWAWIDVIYTLGYIKLLVTFVKYIPQAWYNYQRESTEGWSIWQILFDIAGGILSVAQLFIDSSFQGD